MSRRNLRRVWRKLRQAFSLKYGAKALTGDARATSDANTCPSLTLDIDSRTRDT
jgi:hypothetical protein